MSQLSLPSHLSYLTTIDVVGYVANQVSSSSRLLGAGALCGAIGILTISTSQGFVSSIAQQKNEQENSVTGEAEVPELFRGFCSNQGEGVLGPSLCSRSANGITRAETLRLRGRSIIVFSTRIMGNGVNIHT